MASLAQTTEKCQTVHPYLLLLISFTHTDNSTAVSVLAASKLYQKLWIVNIISSAHLNADPCDVITQSFKLQDLRPAERLSEEPSAHRVELKRNADQTLPGSYFGIKHKSFCWLSLMSSFEG